jgi:hypothetical protein
MPVWVPAVSEGGQNILRTETWTLLISHAVVKQELLQLYVTHKKSTNSSEDKSQKN